MTYAPGKVGSSFRTPAHLKKSTQKVTFQPYQKSAGRRRRFFFPPSAEKKTFGNHPLCGVSPLFLVGHVGIFLRARYYHFFSDHSEPKVLPSGVKVFLLRSSTSFFLLLNLSPPLFSLSCLSLSSLLSSDTHSDPCIMMIKFLILVQGFAGLFR